MATKCAPLSPPKEIPIICHLDTTVQLLYGLDSKSKTTEVPSILQPKVVKLSPDGRYLACASSANLTVYGFEGHRIIECIDFAEHQKFIQEFVFSPKSTYLATYEPYAAHHKERRLNNISIFRVENGFEEVAGFTHTQASERWEPQWTEDEKLFVKQTIAGLMFRETEGWSKVSKSLELPHLFCFQVAKVYSHLPNFAVFVKGFQSSPCSARIYQHPLLDTPVVTKAFFNADSATLHWNFDGTAVLVIAHLDNSVNYYGGQALYYLSLDGTTLSIELSKKGPIYSVDWHPSQNQFAVVYGLMPSSARIYNHKCEPLITLPDVHRNVVKYNPQGNLLCFAGFGGLKGLMEFWEVQGTRFAKISEAEANDTTYCQWCPDGERFLTATLSPRLFEGNGFRVWNFKGTLIAKYNIPDKDHLWSISWRPASELLPGPLLKGVKGIFLDKEPEAYVPPNLRGKQPAGPAVPLAKKHKDAAKGGNKSTEPESSLIVHAGQDDPVGKKIKNLRRKLKDIEKLKQQQKEGKSLEANQLIKLESETELLAQVEALEIVSK